MNFYVLIPAYRPDDKLLHLMESLHAAGLRNILVVNDGSGNAHEAVFRTIRERWSHVVILSHDVNRGKGAALKAHANGAYATDALSAAVVRTVFGRAGAPLQTFYNRSDMRSGSTLGTISLGQKSRSRLSNFYPTTFYYFTSTFKPGP